MCQEAVRKLCNPSESCHVRKVARLLARPLRYGFWIIITGFALVFLITLIATFRWSEVTNVATVVGAVSSLVGTVVGAFFGVQVGAVGKERAEAARERSEQGIKAALSMLPPESAAQLRAEMNR